MSKESAIVRSILRRLRQAGAFAEKQHGNEFSRIGMPDIIGCYRGRFFGIEVKQPGKKPSPAQYRVLDEIRHAGGFAAWMNDVRQVDDLLGAIDDDPESTPSGVLRTPNGPSSNGQVQGADAEAGESSGT